MDMCSKWWWWKVGFSILTWRWSFWRWDLPLNSGRIIRAFHGLLGKKESSIHAFFQFLFLLDQTRETIREKSRVKQIFWKVGTHMPMDIHSFHLKKSRVALSFFLFIIYVIECSWCMKICMIDVAEGVLVGQSNVFGKAGTGRFES